jgi:enoyl-CoA hydratase
MIDYEVNGRIALITLNRVEARNAINRQMAEEMEAAIDRAENDPEVWVAVLRAATTGDRPTFCSGQDLTSIGTPDGNSRTARGGFAGLVQRERTKPLIAAVDGLATAGGCEIVLSCDIVVATTRSSFGLAEVKRNLVAAAGGLFRLPRAIGRATAMDAILTGEPIAAERAYQLGMVSRLAEPGQADELALAVATTICANAPLAVRESRTVVLAAGHADDDALWTMSTEAIGRMFHSEDLQEGLAAFAERRAPQWKGR